jgi:hypothetical protein
MMDPIEFVFYIIEIVLLTAIFVLEFKQFRKEDQYMNGHGNGNSNGNGHGKSSALRPFIAQVESEDSDL